MPWNIDLEADGRPFDWYTFGISFPAEHLNQVRNCIAQLEELLDAKIFMKVQGCQAFQLRRPNGELSDRAECWLRVQVSTEPPEECERKNAETLIARMEQKEREIANAR